MNLHLPTLNAILNFTAACLIGCGLIFIKQKRERLHVICMIAASMTSVLFLTSYLYYHFHHGRTAFSHEGWIRAVYFVILVSHTLLAVVIVPLIIRTVYFGVRSQYDRHRRIARKTYPLWLYVSVTGVVIYLMLYQMK